MTINPSKNYLEIFKRSLKKEINIDDKNITEAMVSMLNKSNIKNFNEYIRTYQYKNKKLNLDSQIEQSRYLKYVYKHKGDLLGHSGQVERIAFDNTGKHVFSGGTDGMIKVWDVETGFLIHTCIGHRNMVNDICFSKDGKYFVSCDFNGIINVWNLETFTIHITIKMHIGVTFVEFFETLDQKNKHNLVVILCNGLVKVFQFDNNKLIIEKENDFTMDEPYKAICITDGGRFLLRAGYWPYLIMLDTVNIDKCIIFDTNNLPVQTICAAKDKLKFAAGCGNWLFQWTYYHEGVSTMGNFNRSTKVLPGHWKKNVTKLDPEDNFIIENMCFLKNSFLICVCTDLKIRVFSERLLRFTIPIEEVGSICAHPNDNLYVLYGQTLKFYYLDKLIWAEKISFSINDCQFSSDGDYFVIGDEMGNVRTYSLNYDIYKYKEQFFISDFEHFTGAADTLFKICKNEYTLDSYRNKNDKWVLLPYFSQDLNNLRNVIVENSGLVHFFSKYLDKNKYRRKYCDFDTEPGILPCETEESIDSISEDSSSDNFSIPENENKSSDDDLIIRRRGNLKEPRVSIETKPVILRRNFVEEEVVTRPKSIRLRRYDNNEDEGLEFFHYQRKKIKKREKLIQNDVPLVNKLRRNVLSKNDDTVFFESSENPKIRLRRHMFSEE